MSRYWGGGGGVKTLFLLTLYNFKNIEGARAWAPVLRSPCTCEGFPSLYNYFGFFILHEGV